VPRFLSPDWVADFNRALGGADLGAPGDGGSLAAAGGRFAVAQLVDGVPGAGEVRTLLVVDDGRATLYLVGQGGGEVPQVEPDVTLSLSYTDAAQMSRGALSPAAALGEGRVRVRGDLAVLVAGQQLLATASGLLAGLQADTTY